MSLDTGSSVPKTQKGQGQGGQWLQPQERSAQLWPLQCPFQNPCEPNRDNLLTDCCPGTPQHPWSSQDSQDPQFLSLLPQPHLHQPLETVFGSFLVPPHPSSCCDRAVRTQVGILPPCHGKQGGLGDRFGGSTPQKPTWTHTQTLLGWAEKAPGWEVFPSAPSAAKPLRPQPKSLQLRAWHTPQRARHGAHGGSGGSTEM